MTSDQAPAQNLSPQHLLTLYEITNVMISSLDFDVVLNNVMDSIMHITKAQRGFLMVADDSGELRTVVMKGVDNAKLEAEGYSKTVVNEVVNTRKVLLTNNAQFDTLTSAGASIIMRGLRAILCAPMMVKDRLMGIVYVDSSMKSGIFTPADMNLLEAVAGQAGVAIENARLYADALEKGRLQKELQLAADIQQSLLPKIMPHLPGYEIHTLWRAARETAGDFYDAFKVGDDRFGIVIADVSDKGAPAALFMAVARTMIRSNAHVGLAPIDVISRTNDLILEDTESDMFVTVYHSHFLADGKSIHVNAGHNPPMWYRCETETVEYMPRGGRAIGWFPNNPLSEVHLDLAPGDCIVYYTDGVTDAENPQKEPYGEQRLIETIIRNGSCTAEEMVHQIAKDVEVFGNGEPPFDDMTIVVVRYTG